jgi:hypothetical protein
MTIASTVGAGQIRRAVPKARASRPLTAKAPARRPDAWVVMV